jgi:hypothetical protein
MRDVESKVAELDLMFSSLSSASSAPGHQRRQEQHLAVSDNLIVGETRAVYRNGVVQFGTATPRPRRASPEGKSSAQTHDEVDLPALQWVEGLHSYLKQSQVETQAAGGAEAEALHGRDVREMRDALEVLTAWRAELGLEA